MFVLLKYELIIDLLTLKCRCIARKCRYISEIENDGEETFHNLLKLD